MEQVVDIAVLSAWMDAQGLGTGPLENAGLLTGGTQNILLKFTRSGRDYVLRRPPLHLRDNSNETMRREARVLAALAGSDVPHPGLIAACPDETVLGASFYLMEPINGFNPSQGLPELHAGSETIRHRMGFSMVEAIASLGALDYHARGLDGLGRPDNYLERQVQRWQSQLSSYEEHAGWTGIQALPDVGRIGRWLEANRPSTFEPGIIHGDYHLSNVMFGFDSGDLAAVVDWELTTIGDPLLDLGWLLATWPLEDRPDDAGITVQPWKGFPSATELVDHYRPRTERDMSHIEWYAILACYKMGIILEGTHARACAGKATKEMGDRLHAHTISLFERGLRWIG